MNPFNEKGRQITDSFQSFSELYPKSYDKREVDPYTKTRIILMNGTEFEANWFSHNFARHVTNNDLRRELALSRAVEKQQQLKKQVLLKQTMQKKQLLKKLQHQKIVLQKRLQLKKQLKNKDS